MRFSILSFALFLLMSACGNSPKPLHDLSQKNYSLLNQDSTLVTFPADFKGDYLIVGFIYTHCPDICPITTANMSNINRQLKNNDNVHFAIITFDPTRDTPSVMKNYMQNFKLDKDKFTMLTGGSTEIDSLLSAMDIVAKKSFAITNDQGETTYLMNHTDRISVMDPKGRVRFEYPGSKVPPKNVIEDLNSIR